jgi:hypothetical protein
MKIKKRFENKRQKKKEPMHTPTHFQPLAHLPAHPYLGLVHHEVRFGGLMLFALIVIAALTIATAMTAKSR